MAEDWKLERQVRHNRIAVEFLQQSVDRIDETLAMITGVQQHHGGRLDELKQTQIEHTVG
jgi:hypothetical protein